MLLFMTAFYSYSNTGDADEGQGPGTALVSFIGYCHSLLFSTFTLLFIVLVGLFGHGLSKSVSAHTVVKTQNCKNNYRGKEKDVPLRVSIRLY